jgi:hypothetical protein
MTNFTAFEVYCTEDKFWAMHECFNDELECNQRMAHVAKAYPDAFNPEVFKVKASNRSVTFFVKTDDAYSMEFANHMVRCWNK